MAATDYLDRALSDWSMSDKLEMTKVTGGTNEPTGPRTRKKCSPTARQNEICNERYGNNGWVGLTSIWTSGGHLLQATSKLNDTYFDRASYNNPQWRLGTLCHELGHTLGLGHPSTDYNKDMHTCIDYYSKPDGDNMVPNTHDYAQLDKIYGHTDDPTSTSSRTASRGAGALPPALSNIDTTQPSERGKLIKKDKKEEVYERNLGSGRKLYTFVILAKEEDQLPQQRQRQEQQDQPQQQHNHEDH